MTFYNPPYGTSIDQDSLSYPTNSTQQVVGGGRSFIVTMVIDGPFTVRDRRSIQAVIAVYGGGTVPVALIIKNSGGVIDSAVGTIDVRSGLIAVEDSAGNVGIQMPAIYQEDVRTITTPISIPDGGPFPMLVTGSGFPAIPITLATGVLYRIGIEIFLYAQTVTNDPMQPYSFFSSMNGQAASVAAPATTGYNKANNIGYNVNSGTLTGNGTSGQIVLTVYCQRSTINTDGVNIVWGRIVTRATPIW